MNSFSLFLVFTFAASCFAGERPPYSIEWNEAIKSQLSVEEQKLATYILLDMMWDENEHSSPDAATYSRLLKGNQSGLEELDFVISKADQGDLSSRRILVTLLQYSAWPRPLRGLERSSILTGSIVVGPEPIRHMHGTARVYISDALKNSPAQHEDLSQYFVNEALRDPDNTALVESVTGILAQPEFSGHSFLRDYFLLMSIHPEASIRMAAHLGLASFVRSDVFVHQFLLKRNGLRAGVVFGKEDMQLVQEVLQEVGDRYPDWRDVFSKIYTLWKSDPIRNRISDRGDYNYERMAIGAAGQAIIQSAGSLKRSFELRVSGKFSHADEVLTFRNTLPRLDGLKSSNGTGFYITRDLDLQDGAWHHFSEPLSRSRIVYETDPSNSWLLMGMSPHDLNRVFEAMLTGGIEAHYGHTDSVISWLKYDLLKMTAPSHFFEALENFKSRLRSKYQAWIDEQKKFGFKVVSIFSIQEALLEESAGESNVVPFAPPVAVAAEDPVNDSIFTAPLPVLFAARTLALFNEKEVARDVMLSLLPDHWELSAAEKSRLAKNVMQGYRDLQIEEIELTDESKHELLRNLFSSFDLVFSKAESRRLLIRWIAELMDPDLAAAARAALATPSACDKLLL